MRPPPSRFIIRQNGIISRFAGGQRRRIYPRNRNAGSESVDEQHGQHVKRIFSTRISLFLNSAGKGLAYMLDHLYFSACFFNCLLLLTLGKFIGLDRQLLFQFADCPGSSRRPVPCVTKPACYQQFRSYLCAIFEPCSAVSTLTIAVFLTGEVCESTLRQTSPDRCLSAFKAQCGLRRRYERFWPL